MSYNLFIGSHVKMTKAGNYLIGCVNETISYDGNTFMFFSASPRSTKIQPTEEFRIDEFNVLIKNHNLNKDKIVIHASYLINLANTINKSVYTSSVNLFKDEIKRAKKIGIKILVLHPGSAVGSEPKKAILQLANALNNIIKPDDDIKIAVETMAGKGSEICSNFNEMKFLFENIKLKDKVGVCWDTCHLNDAGYDIKYNLDSVIKEFNEKIGIKKILAIHLNDSKNVIGSRKDRHANIGYGYIGFDSLLQVAYHPKFNNIPKILETPYINNKPPYKNEINNIKNKNFSNFLVQ